MYELIAWPLEQFYELWPNYAGAIALLTLAIMILLLPLTLKGTRSMLAMQKLQPELKKLQNKHRDDRQKLNEEVMKFYKENNINPMSGCLPLLLQMPVFFLLYQTLFQLLNRAPFGQDMGATAARVANGQPGVFEQFGVFYPRHIEPTSQLYVDLNSSNQMRSFGINLAESAQQAFSDGLGHAWPFLILILAVTGTSYYQQRQIAGRNTGTQMNPQQAMLMKILPFFFAIISFTLPAGIVVYFLVSNAFRIGQQAFITRTMYRDDDGPVETTGKAVDTSSTKKKGMLAQIREAGDAAAAGSTKTTTKTKSSAKGSPSAKGSGKGSTSSSAKGSTTTTTKAARSGKASGPSRTAPSNANRSRNKKKRK